MKARICLLLLNGVCSAALAADTAVKPGSAIVSTNPLLVMFGLLLVVLAIFALAWLVRRLGAGSFIGTQNMKVVSALSVGPRERVVLVDVAGKQILLGVAPGRVSSLHYFERPVVDADNLGSHEFADKMKRFMQPGKP